MHHEFSFVCESNRSELHDMKNEPTNNPPPPQWSFGPAYLKKKTSFQRSHNRTRQVSMGM